MAAVLKIEGKDYSDIISEGGYNITRFDIDDPNTGRTMDTIMHRAVVGRKTQLKIDCIPLTTERFHELVNILERDYVNIEYFDIKENKTIHGIFYNSNRSGSVSILKRARQNVFTGLWIGISFQITER